MTLFGIVIDFKPEQPKKAPGPMVSTILVGVKVTDSKTVQPEKALLSMLVTLSGIVTDVIWVCDIPELFNIV